MHLLRTETRSLDETAPAVDLEQTRADIVALSFTDSDLAVLAKAWERAAPLAGGRALRLASLADLRHPYSVDLYVEKVVAHARVVLIRLLGGLDYWRYGVEEIARVCRAQGIKLAIVPGDYLEDARLDEASTLPVETLRRLWAYMQSGGPDNAEQALRLDEVNAAVQEMDQVTQRNAEMVQRTTGATRRLAEEIARLDELVRQFHIDEAAPRRRAA